MSSEKHARLKFHPSGDRTLHSFEFMPVMVHSTLIERRQISKYCHWKRQPNSLVMATVEGEVNGKARRGRRRTGWIEVIRRTAGSMTAAEAQA